MKQTVQLGVLSAVNIGIGFLFQWYVLTQLGPGIETDTLLALVCVPLVFIASTAVDRMALYLISLQLVVWSRFPVLVQGIIPRTVAILIVIFCYAVVQFVWLVYGVNAPAWVPYQFYHWEWLWQ